MSAKTILNQWLASGEDQRVADTLLLLARQWGDKYFTQEVIHQAGRLGTLQKERNRGVLDDRYYTQQLNGIRLAMQDLVERLPDTLTLEVAEPVAGPVAQPRKADRPAVSPHVPWIVGLLLLAGAVGVLVWSGPCPSNTVGNLMQLLMALGAGGIATLLPGIFNLKFKGVEAGSAIGFAALVYLINPAGVVSKNSGCADYTVLTVVVHGPEGVHQKILDNQGEAVIEFPEETRRERIRENGEASFVRVPVAWLQDKVRIYVQHPQPYQSLRPDSLYTLKAGGKVYLAVALRHTDRLYGTITDASDNAFLDSVRVSIRNLETYTDRHGWFDLHIPADLQMKFQRVTLSKPGYEPATFDSVPVHTQQEFSYALSRVKKRKK